MNKKVNLQGISRMSPSNLSIDGLCRDIVNARIYNGALRPIGTHKSFQSAGVVAGNPVYIHTVTSGAKYLIAYNSASPGNITYTLVGGSTVNTLTAIGSAQNIRFTALHNILLIINETTETIAYSLFSLDTDTYSYIGTEKFPEVLHIDFTPTHSDGYDIGSEAINGTGTIEGDTEAVLANLLKLDEDHYNKIGNFTGSVSVIYAWELFDGSIVKHSIPLYVRHGDDVTGKWQWFYVFISNTIFVKTEFWQTSFRIKTSDIDLDTIRSKYSKIIKSLNIYMTRPLNTYKGIAEPYPLTYTQLDKDSESMVKMKIIKDPAYYLVNKIDIDSLEFNYEGLLYSKDISEIPTLEPMPVDNFTHHKLYGDSDFLYNSRLFLGKTITSLYKGLNPNSFVKRSVSAGTHNGTAYLIYFEIEIKDGTDIKTVVSDTYSCPIYDEAGKKAFAFETFIGYPDSRASSITVKVIVSGVHYKAAQYALTPHPFHNFAYYIFPDGGEINQDDFVAQSLATASDKIKDNNRVQVSKVNNVFVFPAENSYRVGTGSVIGMGANTLLIDSGQFGQFPVYVFTDSGVWAMSISNDISIFIDRIVPATDDVCTNSKSILPTEYGVVFFSSEGVILIAGMKSVRLSLPLEGDHESVLQNNNNFSLIKASKILADTSAYSEDISFLTFLLGAVIGYNHTKDEVIISNSGKEYSYLYSFQSKSWYRAGFKYAQFVNYFPKFLGERSGTLYDVTDEEFTSYIPVFLETYQLKFDLDSFKKITAIAARGIFKSDPFRGVGVYLFASIDDVHWYLMTGNERSGVFQNIILGRSPYSATSLSLVISGCLGEESYLTHLDCNFESRFKGKLR